MTCKPGAPIGLHPPKRISAAQASHVYHHEAGLDETTGSFGSTGLDIWKLFLTQLSLTQNACHFKYPVIAGCWWFQISKYLQCMLIPYLLGHCVMSSIGICTSFFFHHFAATTMEPNAMALKPAEYGEKVAEPIISRFFPDFQSPQMLGGCVVQVQMARGWRMNLPSDQP